MKIKFLAVILLTTLAGPAFAETVKDHYKEVIEQKPYSVEVCKDVTVAGKKNTEGAIFGGILGGVLGKSIWQRRWQNCNDRSWCYHWCNLRWR